MTDRDALYERLQTLLSTVPDLDTHFEMSPAPALVVLRGRRPIAVWCDDGDSLVGRFKCEAALLCAQSAEEAFALTAGRAGAPAA